MPQLRLRVLRVAAPFSFSLMASSIHLCYVRSKPRLTAQESDGKSANRNPAALIKALSLNMAST